MYIDLIKQTQKLEMPKIIQFHESNCTKNTLYSILN
jgi:hypothetical protein